MISSVYFFCSPTGPAHNTPYYHNFVALAEGLKDLGIGIYSNCDYWYDGQDYLFKKSSESHNECDVVIIDSQFYDMGLEYLLPDDLFSKRKGYRLVLNDASDGFITPGFRKELVGVDIVLKSHYNKKYNYPSSFKPWQFGLSNRIIDQCIPLDYSDRKEEFLNNYRVSHPLRTKAETKIAPFFRSVLRENTIVDSFSDISKLSTKDLLYWQQTGRRHYPAFYQRLSESYACFCFGGNPQKFFYTQSNFLYKCMYKVDWRLPIFDYSSVYQYDSWRFWESLVAGCCAIHIDFEKYGIVLPVQPENKKHYIGYDLRKIGRINKFIESGNNIFKEVGMGGREWVLKHYSPLKTAERFIGIVSAVR